MILKRVDGGGVVRRPDLERCNYTRKVKICSLIIIINAIITYFNIYSVCSDRIVQKIAEKCVLEKRGRQADIKTGDGL